MYDHLRYIPKLSHIGLSAFLVSRSCSLTRKGEHVCFKVFLYGSTLACPCTCRQVSSRRILGEQHRCCRIRMLRLNAGCLKSTAQDARSCHSQGLLCRWLLYENVATHTHTPRCARGQSSLHCGTSSSFGSTSCEPTSGEGMNRMLCVSFKHV